MLKRDLQIALDDIDNDTEIVGITEKEIIYKADKDLDDESGRLSSVTLRKFIFRHDEKFWTRLESVQAELDLAEDAIFELTTENEELRKNAKQKTN